jgi:4-alpha-glucanotransferase
MHISSLPGGYGIGDLGPSAHEFVDCLARSHQKYWQVLPTGPTGFADSPYQCLSSFAGNANLISLDDLAERDWLTPGELADRPAFRDRRVEYETVIPWHEEMLSLAYDRFLAQGGPPHDEFKAFCREEDDWLNHFALFMALKESYDLRPWVGWGRDEALCATSAIETAGRRHRARGEEHKFRQWLFRTQWGQLRQYAHQRGVSIIGDIPFYVAHDSCDVWVHRNLFDLDENGHPRRVAGVPPDYFSCTGQLWGNPLYLWPEHKDQHYAWWISRVQAALTRFDVVRIDHFRGFYDYWQIPASAPTARDGMWVEGPRDEMITALAESLPRHLGRELPQAIIAEDLGENMDHVIPWRESLGLAGMKILQFAFGDSDAERRRFALERYDGGNHLRGIMYVGTHDNNTALGWWHAEASPEQRGRMIELARQWRGGADGAITEPHWDMITIAQQCRELICIIPMQDLLGAGPSRRMNRPGLARGNWCWRCSPDEMRNPKPWERLEDLTQQSGRSRSSP